jgi:hypothetical protein
MTKGIRYGEDNKLTILTDNFKVYPTGNVEVKGKITATEGTIGGCTIDSSGKLQVPWA